MAEIALRDVDKYFGENHVIRKLNLTIRHQEFVVLLGPSGCGKTTTLRSIAGLETIDSGDIVIDGQPVQNRTAAHRDIAFVFQFFALYPHLTAYDNIAFPLRATRQGRAVVERHVDEVARALGIAHLLKRRPSQLSGGDMQRVAIGRALVRRPKAMLMDEPIGALDAKLREEMRSELKRLHLANGTTTVYVTHDQVEAMALADRIAIMHDGLLQQAGTPNEVYRHPSNLFVAQFIGSPVMNVSKASLQAENGATTLVLGDGDGAFAFPAELPRQLAAAGSAGPELIVGIRPENVLVAREETPGYIPVEAHIIEPLGAYDIVDLKLGEQFLRARTAGGYVARAGDFVWARLDASHTHFFDPRTEEAIAVQLGDQHGRDQA
jgi:multiple sugar transport system ATP-binding protein